MSGMHCIDESIPRGGDGRAHGTKLDDASVIMNPEFYSGVKGENVSTDILGHTVMMTPA